MNRTMTMRELPASEQPYAKCMADGPGSLSDAELLAVILRCGIPGENSSEMARRLLTQMKDRGGLVGLSNLSVAELCEFRGIGRVKAVQLVSIGELARRISRQNAAAAVQLSDPASIAGYFMEHMRTLTQETVTAAFFNTKGRLLHTSELTRGTVNASLITPREIFLEAMKYRAVSIVLLHNHPSGDPTPSEDDLNMTDRVLECGRLMSIPLLDHIVIGDHCYISLKEQGYIP